MTHVAAQGYPSQSIRTLVGYAAGGGADGFIRSFANELGEALGQPIIIDNRGGGGTVPATQVVASSKPDGYTIFVADNAYVVNPALMAKCLMTACATSPPSSQGSRRAPRCW